MKREHLQGAFAEFLDTMDVLICAPSRDEAAFLDHAAIALQKLIADDAWLPSEHQRADAAKYQQNLLYRDPQSRYSVQSFVWAPGQSTPVHDHTVWGLVGVLRGEELCAEYTRDAQGRWREQHCHPLRKGEIDRVSPTIGDVHRVSNALQDRPSISIHVYGGDIGRIQRSVFDENGHTTPFVSGYSNTGAWIEH